MEEPAEELGEGATARKEVSLGLAPFAVEEYMLKQQKYRFGAGGSGGNPRSAVGGAALLLLGIGGIWTFNNALFNGTSHPLSPA